MSVFLGNKGLTSTEANHYANMAKEITEASTKYLSNMRFYSTYIESLSGTSKKLMSQGLTTLDAESHIKLIASMNTFCAWVREAIKEKDGMLKELDLISLETWAFNNNIELPEAPIMIPGSIAPSEYSIINTWSAEKRLKYLSLEATAATIGKYIHPNGAISQAREEFHTAVSNPIKKEVLSSEIILYSNVPTISENSVEEFFMNLQNEHRKFEKELNSLKSELKSEVNKQTLLNNQKHADNINKFNDEYNEYTIKRAKITTEFNNWKTKEQERISALRIILPQEIANILSKIKEMINE